MAELPPIPKQNAPYAVAGTYATALPDPMEQQFLSWVQENKVPFDPTAHVSDYDMRGFYQALKSNDPRAVSAINMNDGKMHYPDYWKTPYHKSFSADSQWATPDAPKWNGQDQLVDKNGMILFDERAK